MNLRKTLALIFHIFQAPVSFRLGIKSDENSRTWTDLSSKADLIGMMEKDNPLVSSRIKLRKITESNVLLTATTRHATNNLFQFIFSIKQAKMSNTPVKLLYTQNETNFLFNIRNISWNFVRFTWMEPYSKFCSCN